MDPRSRVRERPGREVKPSVLSYVSSCLEEHRRRQELFSQRWVGADYFHEYLSTIEPYHSVLAADMEDLIKIYFRKGRKEFKNCDHRLTDLEKQRLSELVTKYIIEEKAEKSGFQIGILELVRVHPFQVAQELRVSRVHPVGELKRLPECLAFGGGIHLIPETVEWEPMAILWKIWKSSVELLSNERLSIEEYVNLHYRSPSHIDGMRCMQNLNVRPICASKVMMILRKAIRDLTGSPEPKKQEVKYCLEVLYPSFCESMCDFYVRHSSFGSEKTNRRKPIAATFSNRSGRNSGTMIQSLRSSFRCGKQPSACSPLQSTASKQLAADLKSQHARTGDDPATHSKRGAILPDAEKLERPIENSERVPCYLEEPVVMGQQGIVTSSLQGNFDPRSEQMLNDTETLATSSAMSTCQTSQLGESRLTLCDSPEVPSTSRNSPAMPTSLCSNYISKADTVSKQQGINGSSLSNIVETRGLRRIGTVPKRPAPKKVPGPLPGGLNQSVHIASKTVPSHQEADPGKPSKDAKDSEQSSLSTGGQNTRLLSRKQSKKSKTKEYLLQV